MSAPSNGRNALRHSATDRDPAWWQVPLLLAVSVGFESLYLHHGLNALDEGWPLYAAMRLHAGGRLYEDAFFVFPPGHVLPAWIAMALDPPGVILARVLYAGFNVALCAALYALGRRLMSPAFALLGGLLLAVAGPDSHHWQLLFGYRFLVFSVVALLCFARRLTSGDRRWTFAAGVFAGVALLFRLTPSAAVSVGLAVAVIAVNPGWRDRLREWLALALGFAVAVTPALVWFAAGVGLDVVWREAVVRPLAMTDLQSLPVPGLAAPPVFSRRLVTNWFIALQFRIFAILYVGYIAVLAVHWFRSVRAKRPFEHALLLATVLWGGIYFTRSFGRADTAHIESAIPPVCLLVAHLWSILFERAASRLAPAPGARRLACAGLVAATLAGWIFLLGVDRHVQPAFRGDVRIEAVPGGTHVRPGSRWTEIDERVESIRRMTREGEIILDASAAPLIYVLAGRLGPGYSDLVIPGTFLNEAEERAFVERLDRDPPALVIAPVEPFDRDASRAVQNTAPRMAQWVKQRYQPAGPARKFLLLLPRDSPHLTESAK